MEKVETAVASKPTMPSANGITRPRPETLCGQAWAVMDRMSAAKQSPVAIGDLLVETNALGLHPGNVKAEYARWRKFYNVTGRVESATKQAEKAAKQAKLAEAEAKKLAREEAKAKKAAEAEAKKQEQAQEKARKAAEAAAKKEAEKAEPTAQ